MQNSKGRKISFDFDVRNAGEKTIVNVHGLPDENGTDSPDDNLWLSPRVDGTRKRICIGVTHVNGGTARFAVACFDFKQVKAALKAYEKALKMKTPDSYYREGV